MYPFILIFPLLTPCINWLIKLIELSFVNPVKDNSNNLVLINCVKSVSKNILLLNVSGVFLILYSLTLPSYVVPVVDGFVISHSTRFFTSFGIISDDLTVCVGLSTFSKPNVDICKKDLLSFGTGKLKSALDDNKGFSFPDLINTSFSLTTMSEVPLPIIALSPGSAYIPKTFGSVSPVVLSFKEFAGLKNSPLASIDCELVYSSLKLFCGLVIGP